MLDIKSYLTPIVYFKEGTKGTICCVIVSPEDCWTSGQLPVSFLIALIFSTVNLAVSQSALPMHDVLLQDRLHVCSQICWLKNSTVIV